jgi:hypothetical protein
MGVQPRLLFSLGGHSKAEFTIPSAFLQHNLIARLASAPCTTRRPGGMITVVILLLAA